MNNLLFKCSKICKNFYQGEGVVEVLKDIDFSLEKSSSVAITGPSGSGKTTLLNLLSGLDSPTSGEIIFNKNDIDNLNEKEKALMRNKEIGFVYQFHHLLPEFNALENVSVPLLSSCIHSADALEICNYLLKKVNLNNRTNHKPSELSGGERQRVAVARALSNSPSCLIMDEPTGDLDTYNALNTVETILELSQELKVSLIIATHDVSLSSKMDRIFSL